MNDDDDFFSILIMNLDVIKEGEIIEVLFQE